MSLEEKIEALTVAVEKLTATFAAGSGTNAKEAPEKKPATKEAPEKKTAPEKKPVVDKFTEEYVRGKAQEFAKKHDKKTAFKILAEFDANSVAELTEEQYGPFLKKLEDYKPGSSDDDDL